MAHAFPLPSVRRAGDEQAARDKAALAEQRSLIANNLLALIPYADAGHQTVNRELFASHAEALPPIEEASWGRLAFIAGVYGRYMWKQPLSDARLRGLWQTLVWAIHYEHSFRPKMVSDRLRDILVFINGNSQNADFFTYATDDIEGFLPLLDLNPLKKLLNALSTISPSVMPEVSQLCEEIEQRIALHPALTPTCQLPPLLHVTTGDYPEIAQVIAAIEQHWYLLDKKAECHNHELFQRACQARQASEALAPLATLAFYITRNALYRYSHQSDLPGSDLPENDLPGMLLLADFTAHHGSEESARRNALLLHGLQRLRAQTLNPLSFVNELKVVLKGKEAHKAATAWSDLLGLVTHYLLERRLHGACDPAAAEQWVQAFAGLDASATHEQFLSEARLHGVRVPESGGKKLASSGAEKASQQRALPLSFLDEERRPEFLESARHARLSQVIERLQSVRPRLLATLSHSLFDHAFEEILPPRRPVRIPGKNGVDLFPQARAWILGTQSEDYPKALQVFVQVEQETLGREWKLFAQARMADPLQTAPDWEEDYRQGKASWEEIWNLAVSCSRHARLGQALSVLEPGVKARLAPLSHLRFALYCSLQIIECGREQEADAREQAMHILLDHLPLLPIPEALLTWLLLLHETQYDPGLTARLQALSTVQSLLDHPLTLLRPEDLHADSNVETFEQDLRRLKLNDLWRIWIHDYAQRHPSNRKAWHALSETWEQNGDLKQAGEALQHIINVQRDQYRHQIQKGTSLKDLQSFKKPLRASLIRLFEFYQRHALRQQSRETFTAYHATLPELWDAQDGANRALLDLTQPHTEKAAEPKILRTPASDQQSWWNLLKELAEVQQMDDLRPLQARLTQALDLLMSNHKTIDEQATTLKTLLVELCALDPGNYRPEQLVREIKRLNYAIGQAHHLIDQEPALKSYRALVRACERVFRHFSLSQQLVPKPYMNPIPLGLGLPDDLAETSLVLHLLNPGPGDLSNIRISCTDKGLLVSRKEITLEVLPEHGEEIVALPVSMPPPRESKQVDCQIHFTYQWGIVQDIPCSYPLVTRWFTFHDFLQRHQIHDYELPIPYVPDMAINFTKHDPRLFQGRESELNLIRSIFLKGQMAGATPLYFHGIRKVGKTSLLNRLACELQQGNFVPVVVDLHGLRASQQPLGLLINALSTRILEHAGAQGVDVEGITPVPVNHEQPMVGIERFFKAVRERTGRLQLVLLLDEFHVLVAQRTTALLDLLRRLHQSELILFILSGWLHPEPMWRECPETQLFPLMSRLLDFLPLDAVRQVLHAPTADLGIDIPEATVRRVYQQTAGNPFHVAQIAKKGIIRLNAEHRTVLAPQDIDEIAASLADDSSNFTFSSFSPLILTPEEQRAATRFAKELHVQREFLSVEEACALFRDSDLIERLQEKCVLERQADRLRIRGKLLTTYLQKRMAEPAPVPVIRTLNRKRVGLFVDYENLSRRIPGGMKPKEVGEVLARHAARYGEVVCRWVCYDPRQVSNVSAMRQGFEQAGFQVRSPRDEPQTGQATKNLSDFVLLERITFESVHSEPDIFILVSGDKDYYEQINALLEQGRTVHLVASTSQSYMANKYRALYEQRKRTRHAEGYTESDFFIDDLETILSAE